MFEFWIIINPRKMSYIVEEIGDHDADKHGEIGAKRQKFST